MPDVAAVSQVRLAMMSGSLRCRSLNSAVLRVAGRFVARVPYVVEARVVRIDLLPLFNEDIEDGHPEVGRLSAALRRADGLFVASPEYNGHPSGVLKNALDWMSCKPGTSPLLGLPTATVSAAPGSAGGLGGQEHLREILERCGARIVGASTALGRAGQQLDAAGEFTDDDTCCLIAGALMPLLAACCVRDREEARS